MKQINTEIIIHAPAGKIWSILTDTAKYPEWNPFIRSFKGEIRKGASFEVTLQPTGSKPMTFKPTCLRFEVNREFSWLGRLFVPGLFDGEHIFELHPQTDGSIRFVQRENFKGILVPLLWKQLDSKTRSGFEQMNAALKERAERLN